MMKIIPIIGAVALSIGAAFSMSNPAAAAPISGMDLSVKSDVVQVRDYHHHHDSWHRHHYEHRHGWGWHHHHYRYHHHDHYWHHGHHHYYHHHGYWRT